MPIIVAAHSFTEAKKVIKAQRGKQFMYASSVALYRGQVFDRNSLISLPVKKKDIMVLLERLQRDNVKDQPELGVMISSDDKFCWVGI